MALIVALILSTYLFVSPHTQVVTKTDGINRTQSISIKEAFLHYIAEPESVPVMARFFFAFPFLIVFYPIVLIIQSNSEKNWVRIFYIVQGLMLFYFVWHIMQFNASWIVPPVLPDDESNVIVNFKLRLIQFVSIGISSWSLIKGILPRLNFESE